MKQASHLEKLILRSQNEVFMGKFEQMQRHQLRPLVRTHFLSTPTLRISGGGQEPGVGAGGKKLRCGCCNIYKRVQGFKYRGRDRDSKAED